MNKREALWWHLVSNGIIQTILMLLLESIPSFTNAFETTSDFNDRCYHFKWYWIWFQKACYFILTHWIGGMGIIAFAVAIFTFIRIGECSYFTQKLWSKCWQIILNHWYRKTFFYGSFYFNIPPLKLFYCYMGMSSLMR
jgi:hypothetical protein